MLRPTKRQRLECPPSWLDCASLQTVPAAVPTGGSTPSTSASNGRPSSGATETASAAPPGAAAPLRHRIIRTPLASSTTKEIFFDRLKKEIVDKYGYSASASGCSPQKERGAAASKSNSGKRPLPDHSSAPDVEGDRIRALLRKCIVVGVNECTRILESASLAALEVEDPWQRQGRRRAVTPAPPGDPDPDRSARLSPLLVVIAAEGMRPSPVTMTHLPVLADRLGVPVLLLPDPSARRELGRVLGIRSASVVVFLSPSSSSSSPNSPSASGSVEPTNSHAGPRESRGELSQAEADLDSFVAFLRGKVSRD
jgi:hypothetical protein